MSSEESQFDSRSANPLQALGPTPSGSELADTVMEAARRVLRRRFRMVLLIRDAYSHLTANAGALSAVWDDIRTALRLLVAWTRRSYRQVSGASLLILVAALVYFVTPLDVIPDTLGAIGFVDDIAVIQSAVETVRTELDRFRAWEKTEALPSQ